MANKAGIGCAPLLVLGLIVVGISRCFGGGADGESTTEPYSSLSAPEPVRVVDHLYTQAPTLNCRAEPTTSAPRVESLREATFVGVVRREGGWSLLDRSPACWVSSSYLKDSPPPVRPARFYNSGSGEGGSPRTASGGSRRSGGAYRNCSAARAAGAAPVYAGDPGYGRHLDRDGDGIGCE